MLNQSAGVEPSQVLRSDSDDIELQTLQPIFPTADHQTQNADAIIIRNGTFGWGASDDPVLRDISFSVKTSSLTMIIGPVACGKSTLLKALLGETPSSQGFVYVSTTEVAFCDQTPWLINGSVQKNILGFSNFDGPWYNAVVHACGLEPDLDTFPLRDQSLVGSKGITLSGGQKQRLVSLWI
jgi:ABC-type bacteriocin/lantibiotic exporter with double-glycine peptidase domain